MPLEYYRKYTKKDYPAVSQPGTPMSSRPASRAEFLLLSSIHIFVFFFFPENSSFFRHHISGSIVWSIYYRTYRDWIGRPYWTWLLCVCVFFVLMVEMSLFLSRLFTSEQTVNGLWTYKQTGRKEDPSPPFKFRTLHLGKWGLEWGLGEWKKVRDREPFPKMHSVTLPVHARAHVHPLQQSQARFALIRY